MFCRASVNETDQALGQARIRRYHLLLRTERSSWVTLLKGKRKKKRESHANDFTVRSRLLRRCLFTEEQKVNRIICVCVDGRLLSNRAPVLFCLEFRPERVERRWRAAGPDADGLFVEY